VFDTIKRLGTDTAIYGISTIVGRFLNFLLVPFYTNVLLPGDYGIVTYLYSLIAFANVVYSYGMDSAFFKYSSTLEVGTKEENFSTPFFSVAGTSFVFTSVLFITARPIARAINLPEELVRILYYSAGILAFDALTVIPFAMLRLERKAKTFATLKVLNIVINVAMNIYLLVVLHAGVEGIFISGLVASAATFVMLVPFILQQLTFSFNSPLLKSLLIFGLPTLPAGLASMAIQVIDRPILRALTDDATVGIYQANYRLGIVMMLLVSMFEYAWRPFYFAVANEENAKPIFARVLTYFVLLASAVFLMMTFFIGDIVKFQLFGRYLIHPNYWGGLSIVPIVLLGYLFLGVSTNLSAGLYIEKQTKFLPIVTISGAVMNIAANYTLIPLYGIAGAAWATFAAYFLMAMMYYSLAQRVFPIRYEIRRLVKIVLAVDVLLACHYLFDLQAEHWLWRVALCLLFPLLLYVMKFFEPQEMEGMKRMIGRMRENAGS
jgi:O-antigen/teichoic acid export membrane protein